MITPEDVQKVVVRDLSGIIIDLDRLRVVTQTVIRRGFFLTAGIAHARSDHALQTPEPGVGPPKSAQGEGGRCGLKRRGGIDGRYRGRFFFNCCERFHSFYSFTFFCIFRFFTVK